MNYRHCGVNAELRLSPTILHDCLKMTFSVYSGEPAMKLKNLYIISKRNIVKHTRLLVGGGIFFFAATAHAEYSSLGLVNAIEQGQGSFHSGSTFVSLDGVKCLGRTDSYFVIPNNTKQAQSLQMLLTAVSSDRKVIFNHNRFTCAASSVSLCPREGAC